MEAHHGDRVVSLSWRVPDDWNDPRGAIATPEQLSALLRVDALLTDPESAPPPSAWAARRIRAYVPSHYDVCISTAPPKDRSHVLALLPPRAEDLLRDKSWRGSEGDVVEARGGDRPLVVLGRRVTYCSKLTTEEARAVDDALSGLERERPKVLARLEYLVAEGVSKLGPTRIWFEPYFPHGEPVWSIGG